jgi:hypothetical protein
MICVTMSVHATPNPGTEGPITLIGRLKMKTHPGPPGFGETPNLDSTLRTYYIELSPAVTASQLHLSADGGREDRKSYSQVTLWCGNRFNGCENFLRTHVDQVILASGTTAYALDIYDFFPVTMTVGAIDTK